MTKYGSWDGWVVGTGIAPSRPTPVLHHPGYTPSHARGGYPVTAVMPAELNSAVGLISVAQLSLYTEISGFQGFTEVYNLLRIGRINNHKCILQNK